MINSETSTKVNGVSVIIPAYNEQGGIGKVLEQLLAGLGQSGLTFEVIVVDDGSDDRTASIAERAGVSVYRHEINRGYGAALKTGIRRAKNDLICITDADGTYPNEVIPALVDKLISGEFDMVVAARTGAQVSIPLIRRPAKWLIARLAELVAGSSIPDLNSGLRIFRRNVATPFFGILPDGFSFTTTLTLACLTNAYTVAYVPINYHQRIGKSKIRPIRDTLNFLHLVLRVALYFAPLKIFLPLSGLLFLLAIVWGGVSRFVFGQLADVSTVVIMMAAIQVAVIGMLAELIDRRLPNDYREKE